MKSDKSDGNLSQCTPDNQPASNEEIAALSAHHLKKC